MVVLLLLLQPWNFDRLLHIPNRERRKCQNQSAFHHRRVIPGSLRRRVVAVFLTHRSMKIAPFMVATCPETTPFTATLPILRILKPHSTIPQVRRVTVWLLRQQYRRRRVPTTTSTTWLHAAARWRVILLFACFLCN